MKRSMKVRIFVYGALLVCVCAAMFIAHQSAREPGHPTLKSSDSHQPNPYAPYTESELRKLVKNVLTHESVIYNASKSVIKHPTNQSILQGWVKNIRKRQHILTQDQIFACFALAVNDSGSDGERFLKVFQDLYKND